MEPGYLLDHISQCVCIYFFLLHSKKNEADLIQHISSCQKTKTDDALLRTWFTISFPLPDIFSSYRPKCLCMQLDRPLTNWNSKA